MVSSNLPWINHSTILPYHLSPSFVILLSWHADVKKVALITPIFLTSAPQQPQSCASRSPRRRRWHPPPPTRLLSRTLLTWESILLPISIEEPALPSYKTAPLS